MRKIQLRWNSKVLGKGKLANVVQITGNISRAPGHPENSQPENQSMMALLFN